MLVQGKRPVAAKCGWKWSFGLAAVMALAAMGARRIAIEDPCHGEVRLSGASAGLELVPVP